MPNYDEQYTYTNPDLFQTMTAFPPKRWDVRFISDFDTLGCSEMAGGGLSMEAFMAIKPATGREGRERAGISFRWVIGTLKGNSKLLLMAQGNTHPYTTSSTRCCRINALTRKSFMLQ